MKKIKIKELRSQISHLFQRGKGKSSGNLEFLLALASRGSTNGYPSLKIAEIYQKHGEKQKALSWYLKAAEIFCSSGYYHKGVAVYIKILRQEPNLESVKMKLADAYRKMGFLAQAFAQYQDLYCAYNNNSGVKDKALEIIGFMAESDPQKFTLSEKYNLESPSLESAKGQELNESNRGINPGLPLEGDNRHSFDLTSMLETNDAAELGETISITMEENYRGGDIFEELNKTKDMEKIYLDYNFQMGVVCKEMRLVDEAIKHFQIALEKGQKPIEATRLLNQCLGNKGSLEEYGSFKEKLLQEGAIA